VSRSSKRARRCDGDTTRTKTLSAFDVDNCYLTPLPTFNDRGEPEDVEMGLGLAFCEALGVLAVSDCSWRSTLYGFSVNRDSATGVPMLVQKWRLCGFRLYHPRIFNFDGAVGYSGRLAFTKDRRRPLLLATDHGLNVVHVVDPVRGSLVGDLAPAGSIDGPRGIATRGSLVAVSFWRDRTPGNSGVAMYRRDGNTSWRQLWCVAEPRVPAWCSFTGPGGLRISRDEQYVATAFIKDTKAVLMLNASTGEPIKYLQAELCGASDVEEHPDQDGWLVACCCKTTPTDATVDFVVDTTHRDGEYTLRQASLPTKSEPGHARCKHGEVAALALVPGLGLVARCFDGPHHLVLFTTPSMAAMGAMSGLRVAWITVVVRGVFRRARK